MVWEDESRKALSYPIHARERVVGGTLESRSPRTGAFVSSAALVRAWGIVMSVAFQGLPRPGY